MATGGHQSPPLHHAPSPHRTLSPVTHLGNKSQLGQGENLHGSSITEADRDRWSPSQHHQPRHELEMNLNIPQNKKSIDEPQSGRGGARGRGSIAIRGRGRGQRRQEGGPQGEMGRKQVTGKGRRRVGEDNGGRGGAVNTQSRLEAPDPLDAHDGVGRDNDPLGNGDEDQEELPVHQHTCACFLVPTCITAKPSRRSCCYGAYICWAFISVILLMAVFATITVWEVEGQQETTLFTSTNETFKISDVFSNNHLFSRRLCLLGPTIPPNPNTPMSLSLTQTHCSEVAIENTTEIITRKQVSRKSLMFFWLSDTSFELQVDMGTDDVTLYLLSDHEDSVRCNGGETPLDSVDEHNCNASDITCYFNYTVTTSGHYYLCFHGDTLNYTLNISLQYYKLLHNITTQCNMSSDCCQSYGSLSDEIRQSTCIFVVTKVAEMDDVGYELPTSVKSFARLDLVWYSIGTLTVLLLLAAVCTVGCGSVVYKRKHPYTDVACTCHLYQRQHYEPIPPH